MDDVLFQEAKQAYDSGDFRAAAKGFLSAAGEDTASAGAALHMAGNSLLRLRRYDDAATAYEHALEDESYEKRGAILCNLGSACRAAGHYDSAVDAYDRALSVEGYDSPHKAFMGKAGALYDMGRLEEASGAYRSAALEAQNSDPGKALNNLGLCYMALGRTRDAVEAYRAAVGMDGYNGRGLACANLGLALSVLNRHEEALAAFGAAQTDHDYELAGGMLDAFRTSTDSVASAVAQGQIVEPDEGDIPSAEPMADFFTRTDDEMRALDREARRDVRQDKRTGGPSWARWVLPAIVVVVIVVGLAWAWSAGMGWPTQKSTVGSLLDSYAAGDSIDEWSGYWIAVPSNDVEQEMGKLPANFTYEEPEVVESGAAESHVVVAVHLDGGAELSYEFTLAREGVGWRVSGIDNDWRSTGGGS